jgi:hypothetical protein
MTKGYRKPKKNNDCSGGGCGGKTFKGNCNKCGIFDHMLKDCFKDEKNASKHPNGWKFKKEHCNVNVDGWGGNIELLFAGMTFPDNPKILTSKGILVADSCATIYITPHAYGMVDMVAPKWLEKSLEW